MQNRFFFLLITGLSLWSTLNAQKPLELLQTLTNPTSPVEIIVKSPDEKVLLSGDEAGNLWVWDAQTFKVIRQLKAHGNLINSIIFSRDGKKFVTTGDDATVRVWDYATFKVEKSIKASYERVNFGVLTPDNSEVYFGGYGLYVSNRGQVNRASLSAGSVVETIHNSEYYFGISHGITDGNLDASGKHIMWSDGYAVFFYNIAKKQLAFRVSTTSIVNNFTQLKDDLFIWADYYVMHYRWNGVKYEYLKMMRFPTYSDNGYSRIVLSNDYTTLATGNEQREVVLMDPVSFKIKQKLAGHTSNARGFVFLRNDSIVVSAGYDRTLRVWGYPVKEDEKDSIPAQVDTPQTVQIVVEPPKDVVFVENNIPLSVKDRPVVKQGDIEIGVDEFFIEVWDNSAIDGDIISLNFNGEWLLEDFTVGKDKKQIQIKLKPNTNNYLILYAKNLGEIPPNTAAVAVNMGEKSLRLTISSNLNQCGALNFIYVPGDKNKLIKKP